MGCQESHLNSTADLDADVPSLPQGKNPHKKKVHKEKLRGTSFVEKILENVKQVDCPKDPQDLDFIQKTISKHFLLFKLTKQERRQLANAMNCFESQAGDYVFEQGTPASLFFIIREGQVQIQVNKTVTKTFTKGDYFGELALLYSSPRSASVKAVSKCSFWCLSHHIFVRIQRQMVKNNYRLAKPFVNKLSLFSFLSNKQKDAISYNMNTLKYLDQQTIFEQGDDATSFYIIISGKVQIRIPSKDPIQFKNGDSFGQNCLKPNQLRSGTAVCVQKTQLLAMSRQDLKSCLGDKSLEELLFHNIVKWSLKRSQILKGMSIDEQKFISLGDFVVKKNDEIIIQEGNTDDKIYIPLQGEINDYQIGTIINSEHTDQHQSDTFISHHRLIKKNTGYVFTIPLKIINRQRNREKKKNGQPLRNLDSRKELIQSRRSLGSIKVDLKDLYVLCKLGEGQMGKVYLVQNKKTQKLYALKCIQKNIVIKHQMQKFIKCQKEILQIIDNPFLVNLYQTYKDNHFIFLLMNYIEGGDFFDFLSELGICNTHTAQFYIGCLVLAIQYLHKNSIVYRDLKPQNAVVDSNGYLHVIDMGTAKMLTEQSETGFRTFTIIGTPHYMAPEVMQAKGYSFSVDIWALGVILYEMVCGVLPYGGFSDDPVSIYKQIQKNSLRFPKAYTDSAGKELIMRLLQKHSQRRAVHDFSDIKNMDFFRNFNWSLLQAQKMNAPVKPKLDDSRWGSKSQYLLSYLQKQKVKMEKPMIPKDITWDQTF